MRDFQDNSTELPGSTESTSLAKSALGQKLPFGLNAVRVDDELTVEMVRQGDGH
jgi:hypothetical protein